MKKTLKNVLMLSVAAVSAVGMASCGGSTGYTSKNTTFKIAESGPTTGGAAVYGQATAQAAQLAVDEINAKSDYALSAKLELLTYDDTHDASKVAAGYTKMYEEGAQMSLGCTTTKPCLEWANYAKQDSMFSLTPSASGDAVTEDNDVMYQMCFADSSQGTVSGEYFNDNFSGKTVGVLYENDIDYSTGLYTNFKKAFKGTVSAEASFSSGASDFATQANALKNCDVIFLPIYYSEAALFISQAKDICKKEIVYFGCDGLDGIDAVENFNVDEYNTGDYHQEISYLSHFNSNSNDSLVQHFVSAYTAKYGSSTLNQFGAAAYDCVYAIYDAMVAYGKDISVTTSVKDMNTILSGVFHSSTFKFTGVTGTDITWTKDGTVVKKAQRFVVNPRD